MPGRINRAARRKKLAEQEKKPRKKRQHAFARPRMEPAGRVVHAPESCPECHTVLSGGWVQRTREVIGTSGVSRCRSYRTRLHGPDVSVMPETAVAPGASEGSGCRPPAPGGQPRIQYGAGSVKPDRDPAGRGPAARKDHPMVSANVPSSI